jgi:hypothetical protein
MSIPLALLITGTIGFGIAVIIDWVKNPPKAV